MIENQILVKKNSNEVHSFYILKTISESGTNTSLFSGYEVKNFNLTPDKRYKIIPSYDIFLLVQSGGSLELVLQEKNRQRNYPLNNHPKLTNWWVVEIETKDLELLLKEFCHTTVISSRSGEEFKEACSFYLENNPNV